VTLPHKIPTLEEAARWYILGALRLHSGNVSATARALGIMRSSLQRKLARWRTADASQRLAAYRAQRELEKQKGRSVRGAPLPSR